MTYLELGHSDLAGGTAPLAPPPLVTGLHRDMILILNVIGAGILAELLTSTDVDFLPPTPAFSASPFVIPS